MKWVVFVVLLLLVGGVVGVAMLPMSMAADFASKHVAALKYTGASGTVWNGKLQGVVLNGQSLGDVAIRLDAGKIFTGQAAGRVGLVRKDLMGEAIISRAIFGGRTKLSDVKLAGQVSAVPVLPARIRAANGRFTLAMSDIVFDKDVCKSASGEVWTDALSKADLGHHWVGPELRGPVTCKDGKLEVDAAGKAVTGEEVTAGVSTGADLSLNLQAKVLNATQGAAETLTELGFQPESGAYVLHQQLGKGTGAALAPATAGAG
jgi:hypothetical protein